jgi:hypothetical protein
MSDNRRFSRVFEAKQNGFFFLNVSQIDVARTLDKVDTLIRRQNMNSEVMNLQVYQSVHDLVADMNIRGGPTKVLHLTGGVAWIQGHDQINSPHGDYQRHRLHGLNLYREAIFAVPGPKMIWLDDEAIGQFASHAFDLWSWREGPFSLDAEALLESLWPLGPGSPAP